ncbi:YqaJ viral recombinase family protein [Paraburkholderia unamae]|uniref:Phage-related endonuclease n=1 Tax=Paraburkholderia unamae TaxID=219649 RepID=A0ABX5KCI7_9BURK|nr:YqaJ viral recombinase family protein [Paraburkholderia unamae]PVX61280.1 putative phage-related endonuclease [Paraburkholderia unamae]
MTERVIHNLAQGSDEWAQFRLTRFGASEAAAMLGISTKVKRTELLHMKHTGTPKEFSDWVQKNILDYGHEVEALARPLVEELIGDDLYPVTCSLGQLSASCDGLTMSEEIAFEHKQWNTSLADSVRAGVLPEEYWPQCQQIMLVTGAKKVIFVVSDGTFDNFERVEIEPDEAWFERLRTGWEQFSKDLASYEPRDIPVPPKAEAIMALPALAVQIRGEVITSNLPAFRSAAETFIASIKTELKTDEDFVQAAATVNFCDDAEKRLAAALDGAIAQMSTVDEVKRTVEHLIEQFRTKRLALDKLVEKRKKEIKESAVEERRQKYFDHVDALNNALGDVSIVVPTPDFVSAIKGLKTIASLYDKLDTALANGKIVADTAARDLRTKLDWYEPHAEAHGFLFRDLQTLIQKPSEDFQLAVTSRIAEHKRQEDEKEAKRKIDEAAAQATAPGNDGGAAIPISSSTAPVVAAADTGKSAAAPWFAPARTVPTSSPTLRLGQINERLAPIALTAEGLATLGFKHAATDKAAKLYHEEAFPQICAALIRHIETAVQDLEHAA